MQKFWLWAGRWLPVLVLCALVFAASGDSFSFSRSSRILQPLLQWLWPGVPPQTLHAIVVLVRKAAHVTEYALLAVLVWRARGGAPRGSWDWPRAAGAILFVFLYACSDELHQVFVPARQGSVWDVALDTAGGCVGLWLVWAWRRWKCRRLGP